MSSAYTLFGELKISTTEFKQALRESHAELQRTEGAISNTESRARGLGQTTAVVGRQFERMNDRVNEAKNRLQLTTAAFQKGEASASQMRSAILGVDRATASLNNQLKNTNARLTDFGNRASNLPSHLQTVGQGAVSLGRSLTIGLTAPLTALTAISFQQAASFDAMRNRLTAATGSADAGARKFKELFELAQGNAGVFTKSAVELYAFLRPLKLSDDVINKTIKSFGKLKLANEDLDINRFAMNMTQLFSQSFERTDLKEAVGNFPRFGEILQTAFKLSGSDLVTIKDEMENKMTKGLKFEEFFAKIVETIASDPSLAGLGETIGTRMQKAFERIFLALEPFGKRVAAVLEAIMPSVVSFIDTLSNAFSSLSPAMQNVVLVVGAVVAALGPVLVIAGTIASAIGGIVSGVAAMGGLMAVMSGVGIAMLAVVGAVVQLGPILAIAGAQAYALYTAWQTNFGGIRDLTAQVASRVSSLWGVAVAEILRLSQDVTAKVAQFWEANGTDIMRAVTKVSSGIKSAWTAVLAYWDRNGEAIKSSAAIVWNAVRGIVLNAVSAIGGVIKTVAAVINGDWAKAWEGTKQILAGVGRAWANIVLGFGGVILNALKAMFMGVLSIGPWLMTQGNMLGANLVSGFVSGILSGKGTAIGAILSLTNSAISSAKSQLGIQSPSKVFFAIGQDTAQGFIDGIAALKGSAQSAMAGLLDVSGLKLGKTDKSGVEMLTSLVGEIAKFNVVTKTQEVMLNLTSGAYSKLNTQVKERIILAAQELDKMNALRSAMELWGSIMDSMAPKDEFDTNRMKIKDLVLAGLNKRLTDNLSLLNRISGMKAIGEQGLGSGAPDMDRPMTGTNSQGLSEAEQKLHDIKEAAREAGEEISRSLMPPPLIDYWKVNFFEMFQRGVEQMKASLPTMREAIGVNLIDSIGQIGQVFGNAVAQWDGTAKGFFKSIAKGFQELVQQIISELIRLMVIKMITNIISSIGGGAMGGGGGHEMGHVGGFAEGGLVNGPGTETSDSIFARLSKGEFVMSAKAVKNWGAGFFHQLNNGMPKMAMAEGGFVGFGDMGGGASYDYSKSTTQQNINISINGARDPQAVAQSVTQRLRQLSMRQQKEANRNR